MDGFKPIIFNESEIKIREMYLVGILKSKNIEPAKLINQGGHTYAVYKNNISVQTVCNAYLTNGKLEITVRDFIDGIREAKRMLMNCGVYNANTNK